ncbi:hypothetical protein D3C86_1508850 [compost metagenome]
MLSELRHRGWTSSTTLAKALRQLEAVGLLRKTRKTVGVENGAKVCSLYGFTDIEVFERPKLGIVACKATDDYKSFKTLTDAKRAVAVASAPTPMDPEKKKKRALRKLERRAAETASMASIDAAVSAVNVPQPAAETAASADRQSSREANTDGELADFRAGAEVERERLQILHTTT